MKISVLTCHSVNIVGNGCLDNDYMALGADLRLPEDRLLGGGMGLNDRLYRRLSSQQRCELASGAALPHISCAPPSMSSPTRQRSSATSRYPG